MTKTPSTAIAIVICTHNRSQLLLQTIDSIIKNKNIPKNTFSLNIIANACTDKTVEVIDQISDSLIPIKVLEENRAGKSYALNHAINEIKADYYFFLDDDQILEDDYLRNLSKIIETHPIEILTGYLMPDWDGTEPEWVHNKPPYRIPIRPFPEYDLGTKEIFLTQGEKLPSGGNIIMSKKVIIETGFFSTDLGPRGHNLEGGEDFDYITRALKKGFRIFYSPKLRQRHLIDKERMSTLYMLRKSYRRSHSHVLMSKKTALQFYMVKKIAIYLMKTALTLSQSIRFFYLIRLAASFGELTASLKSK